ncbi:hypothetical protein NB723_004020 [Xanthomonas sacchari]|nr:hypothetical protein [Xanthomonas sacchari]MCW0439056.1 hypothetical protein [Xanthomonas sacchari]
MLPRPCTSKPLPMKATLASTFSTAGQSCWKRTLASSSRAVASKRPLWSANGQSSRSPETSAWPSRRRPPCSAASSQSVAALLILEWTQNFFAATTGASCRSAARSIHGREPSSWKRSPPRTSAP